MTPKDGVELEAAIDRLHDRCSTFKKINELRDLERAATASGESEAAVKAQADRVAMATRLRANLGIEFVTIEAAKGYVREPYPNIRAILLKDLPQPITPAPRIEWRVTVGDLASGIEMWSINERCVALRIGSARSMRIYLTEADADSRLYVLPWELALMDDAARIEEWIKWTLWAVDASDLTGRDFVIEPPPSPELLPPGLRMLKPEPELLETPAAVLPDAPPTPAAAVKKNAATAPWPVWKKWAAGLPLAALAGSIVYGLAIVLAKAVQLVVGN